MITSNDGSILFTPALTPAATSSSGTALMSFSKLNADGQAADFAIIDVICNSHTTTTVTLNVLSIVESDTVTSPTSMTAIAALTGTTDATSALTLPGATVTGVGCVIEFQLDLRKRKKYVGVLLGSGNITSMTQTVSAIARLGKLHTSRDTATNKSRTGATYGNLIATSAVGCAAVYSG